MIPRVRSVKPEAATHELLWYCEHVTTLPIIRCFIFLWNWTDRRGLFEWKPRVLKNGIAPYDQLDFDDVLNVLANAGFIVKYVDGGRMFGWVPRFLVHQQINGRESDSRLPLPSRDVVTEHERHVLQTNFEVLTREQLLADAPVLGGGVAVSTPYDQDAGVAHPDESLVYYAVDADVVKIGCSVNPWARIRELRTARPAILLAATEPGGEARERDRHKRFAELHIEREWFRFAGDLADHVATLRSRSNPQRFDELPSRDPSVVTTVGDALRSEQNGTEQNGTERNRNPLVEPAAPASTMPGSAMVLATTSAPPLPAIRGKATASALATKLATVLDEVNAGTRKAIAREQLRQLQAEFVFTYWANVHNHLDTIMDDKRVKRIKSRLDENSGDVGELLYAVDGAKRDKHLMGENDRNRVYDGVHTIFRDREMIERLIDLVPSYRQKKPHKMLAKWSEIITQHQSPDHAAAT
jgi:hypothetical protein